MSNDPQIEKFRSAAESGNPAAQFNMGLWHMRQPGAGPFPPPAQDWFAKSAQAGFAAAQTMLGRIQLGYPGSPRDTDAARQWFLRAAEQGFAEASFQLAELAVATGDDDAHYSEARDWLEMAIEIDHPGAMCQLAYLLEEGIGGAADCGRAIALYQQAASAGVARAWNQIAHYFRIGHGCRADGAMALAAFRRAAKKGYPNADKAADDVDRELDKAQKERAEALSDDDLLAAQARSGEFKPRPQCVPEVLSEAPRIAVLRNLFTAPECQHLIATSRPFLEPSRVVSQEGRNVKDDKRTSWEMRFYPESKDMLIWIYERRLARISETRAAQGEPLMILRYEAGQEYQTHVDFFDAELPGQKALIEANGQRVLTMLTYLSAVEAGGGTEFPELGITVEPDPGSTLAFYNVMPGGQPDPRTLHAGLPVQRGVKWLATRWVRDRDWVDSR